jgi:hypothetical protein
MIPAKRIHYQRLFLSNYIDITKEVHHAILDQRSARSDLLR